MHIIRSKIFSQYPEILFGMSTNSGGVSAGKFGLNLSYHVNDDPDNVLENRKRFFSALGITHEQVAFTRQQHTTNIVSVDRSGITENCDALITNRRSLYLSISVADCTPVMLYDKKKSIIAGIHAGWRGAAGRIVEQTLYQMKKDFKTNPIDIIAFIGPSAGKCCYEVGREVAYQFPNECITDSPNGKFLLDVKQSNLLQLLENGIPNSNIEVSEDCTIHNTIFHSHRRDGKQSGRMFTVIGIKH